MSGTFSVKNFDKFQHYKTRTPPWIKFYNNVLDDYALSVLPDASKAHLFAIWLLASRHGNVIPADPAWIARRINATDTVDLDVLAKAGFIEFNRASMPLSQRKQNALPEREGEGEYLTRGKSVVNTDTVGGCDDGDGAPFVTDDGEVV